MARAIFQYPIRRNQRRDFVFRDLFLEVGGDLFGFNQQAGRVGLIPDDHDQRPMRGNVLRVGGRPADDTGGITGPACKARAADP